METWLEAFAHANFARSSDTAHDLKTPLNVAVLNLELLRMRIAKLGAAEADEKIVAYSRAIETELRRMGRIFDTFFLLSTPPKGEGDIAPFDAADVCRDAGGAAGIEIPVDGTLIIHCHESRMRLALKMFFEGAARLFREEGRTAGVTGGAVTVSGVPHGDDFEITKIFKFYYTDPLGNPDLSLAGARLIAETYGGELNAVEDRDNVVTLRLSFPPGDR
jgi:hypothetical protein